ncbi:putative CocE/NonD family hydrolase [Rhodococcus erythropolis]|uniref:CocE/NonD family hydrolase n=1 Tax=Rhodococcus erythropolis TaxID=1833 RepID=UPI002167FF48|nr:CocE/NonD family hydrolase [Rhodococcus erythropolis]MCS4255890.1 putative CocE/NonD family hydrolase [Rhodococcus erythropolis]MCW2425407.1 putative CocE/NonD family hydrolase [Rhodococcus erythropolis]
MSLDWRHARSAALGRLIDAWLKVPSATVAVPQEIRDMRIPMPDGIELLADRLRPPGETPLPVVLIRSPYGRRGVYMSLYGPVFARHGMQVVTVSSRGTFGSGGTFRPFDNEKEDGLAVIEWLREQTWCDGRIATAGVSYLGFTQWAVAPYLDKPLEAMCVGLGASEYVSSIYPGGGFALDNSLQWSVLIGVQEQDLGGMQQIIPGFGFTRRTRKAMHTLPLSDAASAVLGRPSPFFTDLASNAESIERWDPIDHSAGVHAVTTPVAITTGWYDLFLTETLRDFTQMRAAGQQARLTVGPWGHGDLASLPYLVRDQLSWLSAHLLGAAAQLRRPPVRLYLQQADTWLDFDNWPPPSTSVPVFLHTAGRLEQMPAESLPDLITYDPADPTPAVGGQILIGKTKGQNNKDVEKRGDVLVFTGDCLENDLDVIGEVNATIHVRTANGHADVFVRLCDVDDKGISRNVTDGIVRLRPGAPVADDDGVVSVQVALTSTAYRFRRGHRVRVQVSGGAFPRFARNHGTGEPTLTATSTTPYAIEIFHDPARPSRVVLPVFS